MKTSQTEITKPSKQRGYRFWISRLALLLGLPLLLFYGYCFGLWGRSSLLLQYLFQCGCPTSSDELRYPPRVDVVIPACRHNSVSLSPSGRMLYVARKVLWIDADYVLDLQTGERTPVSIPEGIVHFLNDAIIFRTGYGHDEYLLDLATGKLYPIQKFRDWRSDAYISDEINLSLLVESLQKAKYVFLIDNDFIIALTTDFFIFPEQNFIVDHFDIPGDSYESDRFERFLRENRISF